ncbi:MAG TPA: GAF domain-containing protein [Methylomirabilota bacterium]|jgi:signal transduction histidine kinase/HAMP domain-containing protein|nr:GAF domain-containing protein [Methylomirabilota bacterium]
MRRRGRLSRKYLVIMVGLVTGALLASGAVQIYDSYNENKVALVALEREKAAGAATRIETFVREIERQLVWTTQPLLVPPAAATEQRRLDAVRLQRQVPPITEVSYLDSSGREQLRVSRLAMDVVGSGTDYSRDSKFTVAKSGRTYFGPVYFRKESEPYMTIALPQSGGGVTAVEVNLKFIWDVVSQIRVGKAGIAYVVDGNGALIAHPDISLVLQKTNLAGAAQVKAALTSGPGDAEMTIARDLAGHEVLTAHSGIPSLGWIVFVEQPIEEALAPLRASATRTVVMIALGIVLAVVASAVLARRLAQPIQILQTGAAQIGAGQLDQTITIRTGDELEALADEFNQMTGRLRESYATLEQKVEDRTRELSAALEQQTATSHILGVISGSPTDVQPVLDAVAENAARLCGANDALIMRVEGSMLRRVAHFGAIASIALSRPLTGDTPSCRAALERRTLHIEDILEEFARGDYAEARRLQEAAGFRTVLVVPLIREDTVLGVINIRRTHVQAFTAKQIELVKTFADQAVIAIENVRLFEALQSRNAALTESLEQQTATAEILRVISSSPSDVQPVLATVADTAARLCGATDAHIFRVEGDVLVQAASHGPNAMPPGTRPLDRRVVVGRAVVDRRTVHIEDLEAVVETEFPAHKEWLPQTGTRSILAVPLLREGTAIGAIVVRRTEVRPFSDTQIALLQTFADQAVIAIENVRLFQELQTRTTDLTRSVGELRALGEVGRTLSATLDLPTVLTTIVTRAVELSGTSAGMMFEFEEGAARFPLRAAHNMDQRLIELQHAEPVRLGEGAVGRAVQTRSPVQVEDLVATPRYASRQLVRQTLIELGYRSVLAVPLLVEERILGALIVFRREVGGFAAATVDLLRTFATQSALAIQNARLFREIETKSRELEIANRHKDEFLASMSHELRTPLNAIIGFSEVMLERLFGEINDKQEEYLSDILSSGRHLLSLINDILDLAKIEAGRMELEPTEFDLPHAIENAVVLVRERALRRGITLEQAIGPEVGEIKGDERKIKQVLLNLLSNAVKFTPEGGRIDVRAARHDGAVEISVADTGVGIAPEDHEAVFEEFRQVGTDYARKHEGTGLGLALARKFVELHGGTIRVQSRLGEGATFTFTIPVTAWQAS